MLSKLTFLYAMMDGGISLLKYKIENMYDKKIKVISPSIDNAYRSPKLSRVHLKGWRTQIRVQLRTLIILYITN